METTHRTLSTSVTTETKRWLDECAESRGIRKSELVEAALRHHLQALHDLPAGVIIPSHMTVSRKTGELILARMRKPPEATVAMKALFERRKPATRVNGKN